MQQVTKFNAEYEIAKSIYKIFKKDEFKILQVAKEINQVNKLYIIIIGEMEYLHLVWIKEKENTLVELNR